MVMLSGHRERRRRRQETVITSRIRISGRQVCEDCFVGHPYANPACCAGGEPATTKQKAFLHVLAKQHGEDESNIEGMLKSEASEKIDELKKA